VKLFLAAFLICIAFSVQAQNRVGSAVVDGKIVDLFSDNSWVFRDKEAPLDQCEPIGRKVQFCDDENTWIRVRSEDPDISAQYRFDDRHYAMFILEELGTRDGLTTTAMRNAILENAASAAGISAAEVLVHDIRTDRIDGHLAATIVYAATVNNLPVIFINSFVSEERHTTQAVTYSINEMPTDTHFELHSKFLSSIKLKAD